MLYTSYFAKVKSFSSDVPTYSIAVSTPFTMKSLPCVVPSWDLVKRYKDGLIEEWEYVAEYVTMLDNNESDIIRQVSALPDGAVLCCYEGPGKFCHRHVLAAWLEEHNIKCEEKQ